MSFLDLNHKLSKAYVVDSSVDITGAFKCGVEICDILSEKFDTTLMLPFGSKERINWANDKKQWKIRISTGLVPTLRKNILSIFVYLPRLLILCLILRLKLKSPNDLVILNDINHLVSTFLRVMYWRGKVIVWVRSHPEMYGSYRSRLYAYDLFFSKSLIVCVSKNVRSKLMSGLKAEVLYDFVDLPVVGAGVNRRTDFIMLANYINGKGHDIAIKAVAILAENGIFTSIRFYGSDMGLAKNTQYLRELRELATFLGVEGLVSFNGQISPEKRHYESALAALSLSNFEALSMSVLEACSFGIPVIATRSGGPEEIIEPNESGFLISRQAPEELAEYLNLLLLDQSLSHRLGRHARASMTTRFTRRVFRESLLRMTQ